jgi:uncharacterized protein with GYD domain
MIFITLGRFRKKPTKEMIAEYTKLVEKWAKETGGKFLVFYWTLGRYDVVGVTDVKDEKTAMKVLIQCSDIMSQETLVAVPREEAIKLVE